jgi:Helix-turn-helix domain of resolvase
MQLTHHPFQRAGAWAGCAIAGREHPSAIGDGDLDALAAMITAGAVMAALAPKDGPGYAWWKVLAACYPNSPATHASRARWGQEGIAAKIADLFTPDDPDAVEGPCDLCGAPASRRWGKSLRPLADAPGRVNSQPAGGWPICRECRIAMWMLPYGSASNGYLMVTCGTVADEQLEAAIAAHCVSVNRDAIGRKLVTWPLEQRWLRPVLDGLAAHPGDWELLRWRNDNKAPFLQSLRLSEEHATRLAAWEELAAIVGDTPPGDLIRAEIDERLRALRDRDWIIRAAHAQGYNINQIYRLSGVARSTIYKIIAGNGETGETSS